MGLDTVEVVLRIEDTFGISIPDEVATGLFTPNDVIDYILTQVEVSNEPLPCLTQKAFHLLRRSFIRTLHIPRRSFRLDVPLKSLIPDDQKEELWGEIGRDMGMKEWPSIFRPKWLRAMFPHGCQNVRELVDYLLRHDLVRVKGEERKWTRTQVKDVLWRVIKDETGVEDFTGESRFVADMGVD